MRTSYRLQLSFSGCIYEVTRPRYALHCFATHVETRSPPQTSDCTRLQFLVPEAAAARGGSRTSFTVPSLRKCYCGAGGKRPDLRKIRLLHQKASETLQRLSLQKVRQVPSYGPLAGETRSEWMDSPALASAGRCAGSPPAARSPCYATLCTS